MSYIFNSKETENIRVERLTKSFCKEHSAQLLTIINIIPFIEWIAEDLLSCDLDYYGNKWNYSYVILNHKGELIGVLIAYFRKSDDKHIFDSLCVQTLSITCLRKKKSKIS